MRSLLDVNVLVALFDQDHTFNDRAHLWFEANKREGWASCPITENGLVRILTNPHYSAKIRYSAEWVIESLQEFCNASNHHFLPDQTTLRDKQIFATDRILGSRQITDLYLLSLAASNGCRLVTFDRSITLGAVKTARPKNLALI